MSPSEHLGSDYQQRLDGLTKLHHERKIDEVHAGYQEMLRDYPENAELLYRSALTHHQLDAEDDALALLNKAAELNPQDVRIFNLRGNIHHSLGRFAECYEDYQTAVSLDPDYPQAHNNLGLSLNALQRFEEAIPHFQRAVDIKPDYADAYFNLGMACEQSGNRLGAINALQRCVEINHCDQEAMLRLAALSGAATDRPAERLVEGMFDQYADSFDDHLQQKLGYRTPHHLAEMLQTAAPEQRFQLALDLGCGTGLSGEVLRQRVERLMGVDLSAKMLEKAEEKQIYDELHCGELVAFLDGTSQMFDLFVSSDVLVYVGNLEPLFAAMARRARSGALFLCSTEISEQPGYHLQPSARYAHHPDYVREAAESAAFEILGCDAKPLRREQDGWITGNLYVMRWKGR